ncbi:transposase from transposon Tn916 [Lachnospiraceae bacterium]|nr:site-specific integrase [Lachnospiraceae bacterium]GFI17999.1 transposase from transposon Tn916 [Lachnospiraceae bacterium]GFI68361.1 transposase from transposon Tn916 [Lachnospiraceae bacterium]
MGKDLYGRELGPGFGQRKNGQYYARFENRFGTRQTLYSTDLLELRDKYNTAVYENKKKMNVVDDGTTLDDFFEIWINEYKYKIICENTKQEYKTVYKKHISPILGKRTLLEVTSLMVRALINNLDKWGYGYETKNRVRIMLLDIFDKALMDSYVNRNPVKGIKVIRDEKKDIRVLTKGEQVDFFECAAGTFYYNLFVAAVETGLRPGELYALTPEDINFKKKEIRVNKTLVYQKFEGDKGKSYHLGPPKTKASKRKVPITARCEIVLKKQLNQRKVILGRHSAVPIKGFENLLFLSTLGTPLNATTYCDAISKIVETVNMMKDPLEQMEKFSGHCFRHTFATRCFEAGISPKTIQAYMGHATLQMTMDLYTHVTEEFKQDEIGKLESNDNKVQYTENLYVI